MEEVKTLKKNEIDYQKKSTYKDFVVIDDNCKPGEPKHYHDMENSKLGRMLIALNYM